MPSSMTHTYFGLDVLKALPKNCQDKICGKQEYFKLFCQGSDPFMFYHFFLGNKAREGMKIQSMMHHSATREFFIQVVSSIYYNKLLHQPEVMAYLYGYICHYYLDLYTHPLICYKSGIFKKSDKNTYRYNAVHQKLEYDIDLYMIQAREKDKPYRFKVYQHIFQVNEFSPELKNVINESIDNTYHYPDICKIYLSSIRYMKLFFRYVNHDPTGIKLKIYKFIDKLTPLYITKLEELSYHHDFENDLSSLNLEHLPWNYPWDLSQVFTTSFFDLYDAALVEAVKAIKVITIMLEKNQFDVKVLEEVFQNLSFSTGKPCQEKLEMKYFEY